MPRFYHGGGDPKTGGDPTSGGRRWLTPDKAYAEAYARRAGGQVYYVDIPASHPALEDAKPPYFDEMAAMGAPLPYSSFEAPEEIAGQLKPLAGLPAEKAKKSAQKAKEVFAPKDAPETKAPPESPKESPRPGGSPLGRERSPDAPTAPQRYGSELGRARASAEKARQVFDPPPPPKRSPAPTPPVPTVADKARKVFTDRAESPKPAGRKKPPLTPKGKLGKRWADMAREVFAGREKAGESFGGAREVSGKAFDDAATKKLTAAMEKLAEKVERAAKPGPAAGRRGEDSAERPPQAKREPTSVGRSVAREAGRVATVGNQPGPVERLVGQMVQKAVLTALISGS